MSQELRQNETSFGDTSYPFQLGLVYLLQLSLANAFCFIFSQLSRGTVSPKSVPACSEALQTAIVNPLQQI